MQSPFSIPPYTEAGLTNLIGVSCSVPMKGGSLKHRWWGTISHVRFVNENSAAAFVQLNCARAGNNGWYDLKRLVFTNHIDELLKVAIHRARLRAKELGIV